VSIRDRIVELAGGDDPNDPLLFLDPPPENADECIVGVARRCGMAPVAAYDQRKVLDELANEFAEDAEDGMQDAIEWFEYNTIGAWVGDRTPIFIEFLEDTDMGMTDPKTVEQVMAEYRRNLRELMEDFFEEMLEAVEAERKKAREDENDS